MPTCIICRQEKSDFNDEHVIPESIGGYYHSRKVCVSCNSRMGTMVDSKLTNHKFIEFQRHLSKIKGKTGTIPNPFAGTHVLDNDPEQKVTLSLDKDGKFKPNLITTIKKDAKIPTNFSIHVDKKNENKIDEIVNKFLERNGIPKDQTSFTKIESSLQPWIKAQLQIDICRFKLSLLKIAYEF